MSVSLRLVRVGRRHRPFYRLRAADTRAATTGRFLEELGTMDPIAKDPNKQVALKKDRIEFWLSNGAKVSATVRSLLKKNGIGQPAAASPPKVEGVPE